MAEEVKSVIIKFLAERGLSLSEEKTKIVHISEGFDFLSWNFRKYNGKLLIKPSVKAVSTITMNIGTIIRKAKGMSQDNLIRVLNPVIMGWALYHRNAVSSEIFSKMNHVVWGMLWHWAKRRHPNKGHHWIVQKYWQSMDNTKRVFTSFKSTLLLFTDIKIKRHIMAQLGKNPFLDVDYFDKRDYDCLTMQTSLNSFF